MCVSHSILSNSLCPMDCSPWGSSIHGILQAKILEWVAISFSRGSTWPRDWTQVSCFAGGFFTVWATTETLEAGYGYVNEYWHYENIYKKTYVKFITLVALGTCMQGSGIELRFQEKLNFIINVSNFYNIWDLKKYYYMFIF